MPPLDIDERLSEAPDAAGVAPGTGWKRYLGLLVAGQTVTAFGSMLVSFAVMWHLVLTTGSGVLLTVSIVVSMVPQALVSVFGGVWADRYNRKALIVWSDGVRAVLTLALALMLAAGFDHLWLLFTIMGLRSALGGIQVPAAGALLPQLAPASQLLRVNGLRETLGALDAVIAPGVAAFLVATGGLELTFGIDVLTTVIGIALLAVIPVNKVAARVAAINAAEADDSILATEPAAEAAPGEDAAPTGYFCELKAGVSYVIANRAIRWVTLLVAGALLFLGAPAILTTLMVHRNFGGEPWMLAANEIAWFAGMMAVGGMITVLARRLGSTVRLILIAIVIAAASTAALGLAGGHIALFLGVGAVNGAAFALFMTPATTFYQEVVEPELLGRVFGVVGVVTSLAMPISMIALGPLADVIAIETVFFLGGAGLILLLGVFAAIPTARRSIMKAAGMRAIQTTDVTIIPGVSIPDDASALEQAAAAQTSSGTKVLVDSVA